MCACTFLNASAFDGQKTGEDVEQSRKGYLYIGDIDKAVLLKELVNNANIFFNQDNPIISVMLVNMKMTVDEARSLLEKTEDFYDINGRRLDIILKGDYIFPGGYDRNHHNGDLAYFRFGSNKSVAQILAEIRGDEQTDDPDGEAEAVEQE